MDMLSASVKSIAEQKFKIDFILCTRNRSKNIFELLGSINNLVGCEVAEVTVVDSSDNPIKLSSGKFSKIGNINLIHSLPGLPTQRNIGLKATHNPIIVFLDDDVLLENNFIIATLQEFENNLNLGGMGYLLKGVNFVPMKIFKKISIAIKVKDYGQITKSGRNYWYPENGDPLKFNSPMWLPGCAMAFRRAQIDGMNFNTVLEKGILGGYALGEDVDFALTAYGSGQSLGLCVRTTVNHYEAPGERDNPFQLAQAQGHWLKYLAKSHQSYVIKSRVFLRLFTEFIYLLFTKFIGRGSPNARICSRERLIYFLRSSPYSELN